MPEQPNKARNSVLKTPNCSKLLSIPLFKIINDNKNDRLLLDKRVSLQPSENEKAYMDQSSLAFFTVSSVKRES